MLQLSTGLLVPAGCHRLSCPVCVVVLAFRLGAAIGLARPDQQVLLTQVGEDWTTIRRRMNHFRRILKGLGVRSEDVYHVEPNPQGTGCHVHMWRWGDRLARSVVAEAAVRAGMGSFADVQPRRQPSGSPLTYGLKTILNEPSEGMTLSPGAQRYLDLNGNRLCHASRNFWRDETGGPLPGVRAAAKQANHATTPGKWVTTHVID